MGTTGEPGSAFAVRGRTLPALDGVRALAIAGVIAYHLGAGWASGGYLGVDLFFVLSGFLITSLLVEEHLATGTVALGRFWARRARRLLPALLLMLVVVTAAVALFSRDLPIDWHELRNGALATIGYVANWQLLAAHQSYFDRFAVPSPFKHTWSLAIEEQFYLCWPLVLAGLFAAVRRARGRLDWRRAGLVLTAGGAVASAAWMAYLHAHGASVDRLYYGTDTRAFDLLAGAAVAMATAGRPEPSAAARRVLAAGALGGLAVLGLLAATAGEANGLPRPFMFEGGFALAALAASLLVATARLATPGLLGRALSLAPVRYVGRISYGLYLWHWPVIVELTPARVHESGLGLAAVRLGVTAAVSVASFHLVEQPIRRGWPQLAVAWKKVALAPVAMAAAAGAVLLATVPPVVATASAGTTAAKVTAAHDSLVPGAGGVVGGPIALGRPVSARRPLRLLLLGDSVMLSEAPAIAALFDSTHEVVVENHSQWGFGLTALSNWRTAVPQWIAAARPDVVVAMWSWDNVAYARHPVAYRAELEQFVRTVLAPSTGVRGLVFQQFPAPGPDEELTTSSPDYDARVAFLITRFDGLLSSLARAMPHRIEYLPLGSAVTWKGRFATWLPPEGDAAAPPAEWLRVRQVDNVHFCPAGAARYATALYADLAPQFRLRPPEPGWIEGGWVHNYLAYRFPSAGDCPADHP